MSQASSRGHASYTRDESKENLRSKRSSITIEWSDGSKVIFVKPRRPGTYSVSHSPPSPISPVARSPASWEPTQNPEERRRSSRRSAHPSLIPTSPNPYSESTSSGSPPDSSSSHRTASPLLPKKQVYYPANTPSQSPTPSRSESRRISQRSRPDQEHSNTNPKGQRMRQSQNHYDKEIPQPKLSTPDHSDGSSRPSSSVHGETGRATPVSEPRAAERGAYPFAIHTTTPTRRTSVRRVSWSAVQPRAYGSRTHADNLHELHKPAIRDFHRPRHGIRGWGPVCRDQSASHTIRA
ncbi:hypothetical protein F4861DRAFT_522150 [Xylaria intraflava]|nr:hypothetical protein F4861DRAFT_522150 [Xylaria intraflava]